MELARALDGSAAMGESRFRYHVSFQGRLRQILRQKRQPRVRAKEISGRSGAN